MKLIKSLSLIFAVSALFSCVDKDYDLNKDIDDSYGFQGSVTIPLGNTEFVGIDKILGTADLPRKIDKDFYREYNNPFQVGNMKSLLKDFDFSEKKGEIVIKATATTSIPLILGLTADLRDKNGKPIDIFEGEIPVITIPAAPGGDSSVSKEVESKFKIAINKEAILNCETVDLRIIVDGSDNAGKEVELLPTQGILLNKTSLKICSKK